MNSRLSLFLSVFLAPVVACSGGGEKDDDDTATPVELDDIACTNVDLNTACPTVEEARQLLVGSETCESPVREVVAIGDFVSEENVEYSGYGGFVPFDSASETADTGGYSPYYQSATRCCYEAAYSIHTGESCAIGRPLTIDGEMVTASPATRQEWLGAVCPDVGSLDQDTRRALADSWLHDALMEHASIPAFARVAMELSALGAPPELLRRTAEALADEVRHAQLCFALASAYAGEPLGPTAMATGARAVPTLAAFAVETFREGCVGESLAAARAAVQLKEATDPAVRGVLEQIVHDETRHAELAWDTVRWALATGDSSVADALAAELANVDVPQPEAQRARRLGATHGLPNVRLLTDTLQELLDTVVRPMAEELLAA